jgi:hypothetical protein
MSKGPSSEYDTSLWYNDYPTVLWTPGTSLNCYLNGTSDIPDDVLSTDWTFSCYIKAQDGGTLGTSNNDLGVYIYHPSTGSATGTTVDVGNGWYRVFRSVSGSSNYVGLAGFSGLRAGVRFYLSGAQLEKKTYPTPYVTGFTNSGEVYDGRPATTNLMIDGKFTPSGGTVTTSGGWTTHVFTSSGTFTPGCNSEAEILVVAGGGGGGTHSGGGGGAGGLLYYGSETPKTPNGGLITVESGTAYTITVGAGGAGGLANYPVVGGRVGISGSNSAILGGSLSLTAIGGGGGGSGAYYVGLVGGSGGGGGRTLAGGAGTAGQGNAGSNGVGSVAQYYSGAGGGGAGGTGTPGNNTDGGAGGVGLAYSISGSAVYYAGGGGGNIQGGGGVGGSGGNGGGGDGSQNSLYGFNATDNTGGGGGGSAYSATPSTGRYANGGSGIVIIRYRTFQDSSPSKHTVTPTGDTTHSDDQSKFSGGSIYFDGSDSLTVPDNDGVNDFGTGDYTIDFWFNSSVTNQRYTSFCSTEGAGGGYTLLLNNANASDGTIAYWGALGSDVRTSSGGYNDGSWHHVALVRNGTSLAIYVDGVSKATATSSSSESSSGTLRIGNSYYTPRGLTGYMDEFRVTKGTALWTSTFNPPTRRNLKAPVVDLSGSGNGVNLAVKSATGVATYRKGQVIEPIADAIWDFDGTDEYFDTGLYLSSTCSISCWYKRTEPDITSADDPIMNINCWNNNVSNNFFYFYLQDPYYNPSPGGSVEFWAYGYTAGVRDDWYPSGHPYASYLNVWRNVCVTFDGSSGYAYVDGEYMGSDTLPFTAWKAGDPGYSYCSPAGCGQSTLIFAGRRGYGSTGAPTSYFNGEMASCTVFNKTLTASQVKQNFNSQRSRFKV